MRENKPKVLDLEGMRGKLENELDLFTLTKIFCYICNEFFVDTMEAGQHFREEHNDEKDDNCMYWLDERTKSIMLFYFRTIYLNLIDEIKSRIKSACEFFLRYKDKPELFVNENSEMTNDVIKNCSLKPFEITKKTYVQITSKSGWFLVNVEEYNEWLFRLAFKDVFEDGGSHGEERS